MLVVRVYAHAISARKLGIFPSRFSAEAHLPEKVMGRVTVACPANFWRLDKEFSTTSTSEFRIILA